MYNLYKTGASAPLYYKLSRINCKKSVRHLLCAKNSSKWTANKDLIFSTTIGLKNHISQDICVKCPTKVFTWTVKLTIWWGTSYTCPMIKCLRWNIYCKLCGGSYGGLMWVHLVENLWNLSIFNSINYLVCGRGELYGILIYLSQSFMYLHKGQTYLSPR